MDSGRGEERREGTCCLEFESGTGTLSMKYSVQGARCELPRLPPAHVSPPNPTLIKSNHLTLKIRDPIEIACISPQDRKFHPNSDITQRRSPLPWVDWSCASSRCLVGVGKGRRGVWLLLMLLQAVRVGLLCALWREDGFPRREWDIW